MYLTFPDITLGLAGAVSTSAGPASSPLDLLLRGQLLLKGAANCSKQCGVHGRCNLAAGTATCECECGWKGARLAACSMASCVGSLLRHGTA
jgi:hypothetical protein